MKFLQASISDNLYVFVLTSEIKQLSGLRSIPIASIPFFCAPTKLDPEPQNGSKNNEFFLLIFSYFKNQSKSLVEKLS